MEILYLTKLNQMQDTAFEKQVKRRPIQYCQETWLKRLVSVYMKKALYIIMKLANEGEVWWAEQQVNHTWWHLSFI